MLIPARFNGPPGSGNGGWSAGHFAVAAGARAGGDPIEVTLRLPPPLETPLTLTEGSVYDPDGTVVAQVRLAEAIGPTVAATTPQEAATAAAAYPGLVFHPFPGCYVCGPDRDPGDGLRIFPGLLRDGRTAAPWTVPPVVSLETMWAALDCPGGWSVIAGGRVYVLGRIAAEVTALPAPGAQCIVVGAVETSEGRKAQVRSTVYGPDGRSLATARATWIAR
ncbi:MAG TPA: hypothetical protein VFO77_13220 [Actinoplanes sp.]|nr:hypothetical protein [Actinoplanes sp.]